MSRKGSKNTKLKCLACKIKFPRDTIEHNDGFCDECITHSKLCDCGCGEPVFRYTKEGYVRKIIDNSHGGNAGQCAACKERFHPDEIKNNHGFCDNCITHTTWCECGCEEALFRYNQDGSVKRFAGITHAGKVFNQEHQERWESDPEYREWYSSIKSDAAVKAFEDNPELKKLRSQIAAQIWQDHDFRETMSQKHRTRYEDPEERAKLSRAQIERFKDPEERKKVGMPGALNPAWKGGIAHEPYDEEFHGRREKMRARQDHRCADEDETCDTYGEQLSVHHIDEDKKNSHPSNLIALCRSHHGRAHNLTARTRHEQFVKALMSKED